MNVHWDRKLAVMAVVVLIAAAAAVCGVVWWVMSGSEDSGERIRGKAEDGYAELMERAADPENVGHIMIAQKGKYSTQEKYEGFDEAWLTELIMTGHEYMEEEISYRHTVRFRLRTYDTESIYLPDDTRAVYGRYTDDVIMFRNGSQYYVMYRSGAKEYRFIAECPPLTAWLEEVDG